jgi:hypothetical protein
MRKVYVDIFVRLIIQADEGVNISEVIDDMDYEFTSNTDGAEIIDTELDEYEVTDSK